MGDPKQLNANFPMDDQGHTLHVGIKAGEIANRIITVGDPARAILLSTKLDGGNLINPTDHHSFLNFRSSDILIKTSSRLFTTVTGKYKGVPVSIVAIGMGVTMMDFFIREVRACIEGPLHIIRFGSCGSPFGRARAGDIVVATGSMACSRNYDYFHANGGDVAYEKFASLMDLGQGPYFTTTPVYADQEMSDSLVHYLQLNVPAAHKVVSGMDITTDSFYSSQARLDPSFNDANTNLLPYLEDKYPNVECLQMETFGLMHLAHSALPLPGSGSKSIRTAACAMVFAHRTSDSWIDPAVVNILQKACSTAVLESLIHVSLHAADYSEPGDLLPV